MFEDGLETPPNKKRNIVQIIVDENCSELIKDEIEEDLKQFEPLTKISGKPDSDKKLKPFVSLQLLKKNLNKENYAQK